jgi:putative flippase GtrA
MNTGMGTAAANTVSTVIAVVFAFFINKFFVFRSASWVLKVVLREFAAFCLGRLATYLMETGLLVVMIDWMGWPSMICKGFTMVLVVVGNYIISKWAVFRNFDSHLHQ